MPSVGAYSVLAHLGGAIWPGVPLDRRWFAVVSLDCYADASGTQSGQGFMSVVGLVASQETWSQFRAAWDTVLAVGPVSSMHMKTFVPGYGEFESWRLDRNKRDLFARRLLNVIRDADIEIFASAVGLRSFNRVNRHFRLAEAYGEGSRKAGAYAFLAENVRGQVVRWWRAEHNGEPLAFLFESGDTGQAAFRKSVEARFGREAPLAFVPKVCHTTGAYVRPLEAADVVAWPYRRMLHDVSRGMPLDSEPLLDMMVTKLRPMVREDGFFTEEGLTAMCVDHPHLIPERK